MNKGTKFVISLLFAVLLPWVIVLLFLSLSEDSAALIQTWLADPSQIGLFLPVLAYESIAYFSNILILGYGFWIPLLIWIVTGLICGIINRSTTRGLLSVLIGLGINLAFFLVVFNTYVPASLITDPALLNISLENLALDLIMFLGLYSLILPGGLMGGLFGGVISRFRLPKEQTN
jgi:hypothetical protein